MKYDADRNLNHDNEKRHTAYTNLDENIEWECWYQSRNIELL